MEHCMDIKIYYEDTDCGGVVYYGKYLAYLERARTEYMAERGISLAGLMEDGVYFVVVHVDIRYLSPARYGDTLSVCSTIKDITPATITFDHMISHNGTRVATAKVKLACIGRDMKPKRMDRNMVEMLRPRKQEYE